MATHDIAVIGAVHNGPVAANYLADAGLSVIVVEAATTVGGMTATGTPSASRNGARNIIAGVPPL